MIRLSSFSWCIETFTNEFISRTAKLRVWLRKCMMWGNLISGYATMLPVSSFMFALCAIKL